MSCHDLTTVHKPPSNFRSLLGLGLGFCPQPRYTTYDTTELAARFQKKVYTRSFFAGKDNPDFDPKLYIPGHWTPPNHLVSPDLRFRVQTFLFRLRHRFRKKQTGTGLIPPQRLLLRRLAADPKLVVIRTNKNLGPAVLERSVYIHRALHNHLLDKTTYSKLTRLDATIHIQQVGEAIGKFVRKHKKTLGKEQCQFLRRSLKIQDPFPHFYITAKIHKTPWKTRPIVSVSGSISHGLGRWVDAMLQPICHQLPTYLQSSLVLVDLLRKLPPLPPGAKLFIADAVSMYTNINTNHALSALKNFLRHSPLAFGAPVEALLAGLSLIMTHNVFAFDDTYWLQINGTAMGTPPACTLLCITQYMSSVHS